MKLAALEAMWETEPAPAGLTAFGIPDLKTHTTHAAIKIPYVLGLISTRSLDRPVAGILPLVAVAVARLCRPSAPLTAVWALALALAPAWVGYFVHVEALGSLLAGLVLAAFALGLQEGPDAEHRAVLPSLLVTLTAVTLLAAPWLVTVMNATRQSRINCSAGFPAAPLIHETITPRIFFSESFRSANTVPDVTEKVLSQHLHFHRDSRRRQ